MRLKLLAVLSIIICFCDFVNCLKAEMGYAEYREAIDSFKKILKIEDFKEQESCVIVFCANVLHGPIAKLLNETKEYLCEKSFAIPKQEYITLNNGRPLGGSQGLEQYIMKLDLHAPWKEVKNYAISRFLQMRLSDLLKNFIISVNFRVHDPVQLIRTTMRRQFQSAMPTLELIAIRHRNSILVDEPNLPIMSGIPIDQQEEQLKILRNTLNAFSGPLRGNNQLQRFSRTVPQEFSNNQSDSTTKKVQSE